jgi:hypothetical protein
MRSVSTNIVSPGEYYIVIQSGIMRALSMNEERLSGRIGIIVIIDGIPLSKSTKNRFWPITARLLEPMKRPPLIIGIYYRKSDPLICFEQREIVKIKTESTIKYVYELQFLVLFFYEILIYSICV